MAILPNMNEVNARPHREYIAEQARIFKALGHPSRLLMVQALRELIGADMSTVSRHLAVLREAGVVRSEKRGTNIYYALALSCLDTFLHCTGTLIAERIREKASLLGGGERAS